LGVADIDGDGKVEIVHGPDWYNPPPEGPLSGLWQRKVFAPGFREMCRTALVDITGNGLADVVLAESKYSSGRVAWFENRLVEDSGSPWIEHEMDWGVNFAHSLGARRDPGSGEIHVFLAEMAAGDWNQPYNLDARLIEYTTSNNGRTWQREILHRGAGTHQALVCDVDGDGTLEIVGKERELPRVQIWKSRATPSPLTRFHHRLLDRDKPCTGTDIVAMDVDDDGLLDVVCGAWWYKNPTWERYDIPDIYQVHNALDIDGDGRQELIASKRSSTVPDDGYSISMDEWYHRLSSEFCWLKPVDGEWEEHPIGTGHGNWPHGTAIAPVLPGGKLALMVAYHSVHLGKEHFPEIFEVPADPRQHPWPKRVLAEILYGEEIVAHDIDGDGTLDLVAGPYWLENLGDGTFRPHQFAERLKVNQMARLRVADVNGNGKPDIVLGEQALDFENEVTPWSRLLWFEHPEDPKSSQWEMHVIDKLRCPHSLDVADLDGDGELEIVCAEHDPFKPYHSRCRHSLYTKRPTHRGDRGSSTCWMIASNITTGPKFLRWPPATWVLSATAGRTAAMCISGR
jgi:hypothetical protein